MSKKLTISELSRELGVSVNTIWKRISKRGLITGKEIVNNREITVITLSDEEYSDLINEKKHSQPINNTVNNTIYEDSLSVNNTVNTSKPLSGQVDLVHVVESIMNYSRDMNNQVKEYVDRVINAEKQVKLLEDIENRKEAELHRLIAECKTLEDRNALLIEQNANLLSEKQSLSKKSEILEAKNAELETKIKELENPPKKPSFFGLSLK
jgi:hypothetical protein